MKAKIILSAALFISLMTSCHKDRFVEYVAEMSIEANSYDSIEVKVSGYVTNSIENAQLGFSYTTQDIVYSWNSENVYVDPGTVTNGSYSSFVENVLGNTTYNIKPFADVNGTKYYTEKEFSFTAPNPPNSIGDVGPGGGIVFYSDGMGGGMEVLVTNWHGKWGGYNSAVYGTGTSFGTGQENTNNMLYYTTDSEAAQMCDSCTAGGFSDWFLPSYEELGKIQLELGQNSVYNLPSEGCWSSSSSASGNQYAWVINLADGSNILTNRNSSRLVLPVRIIE